MSVNEDHAVTAVREAIEFLEGDRPFKAFKAWVTAEEVIRELLEGSISSEEATRKGYSNLAALLSNPLIHHLRSLDDQIIRTVRKFNSYEGWTFLKEKNNIKCWSQRNEHGVMTFRIEGLIHCNLFATLACFYEVDLHHEWVPNVNNAIVLADSTKFRRYSRAVYNLPWPYWHRSSILLNYGDIILPEDFPNLSPDIANSVVIFSNSITAEQLPPNVDTPPYPTSLNPDKMINMYANLGFVVSPTNDENVTRLYMTTAMDMNTGALDGMLEWINSTFCYFFIPMIEQHAFRFCEIDRSTNAAGVHLGRVTGNSPVYDDIRARLELIRVSKQNELK